MPTRLPFFEVEANAYLFPEKVRGTVVRKKPEEPVRQWCAYELIRAYGISISNIEFERSVRMGSRPHWIDILVSREGRPFVVVECKRASVTNLEEAMEQALSYADAPEIRAEFAVVSNGEDWRVKRRVNDQWCAVPDLPREIDCHSARSITDLLYSIDVIAPLLYKLNESLEGEEAQRFLSAMQELFCGVHMLTSDLDRDLLIATDNLLRVASLADEHPNYRFGKLKTAIDHFEAYRKRTGLSIEFYFGHEEISHQVQYIHASLLQIIESADAGVWDDMPLLRVNAAIAEYGIHQGRPKVLFPKMALSLHQTLHEFLNRALKVHLNAALPDHLDDILLGDMRRFCQAAWDALQVHERVSFREFVSAWVSFLFSKLRFSR
jgi:hypothetical protein